MGVPSTILEVATVPVNDLPSAAQEIGALVAGLLPAPWRPRVVRPDWG